MFIRGVSPNEFTVTNVKIGEADKASASIGTRSVYTKIPKRFTDVESWRRVISNLKCWTCDRLPYSYPKFIPTNPEIGPDGVETCEPKGNFDEWNCVIDYIRKNHRDQAADLEELTCRFASKFAGRKITKIQPSPPKTEMEQYGGTLTAKQYQEKINQLNVDYDLAHYKIDHFKNGAA